MKRLKVTPALIFTTFFGVLFILVCAGLNPVFAEDKVETRASVSSDKNTTQGFVFDDSALTRNDQIVFQDGGVAVDITTSIINDGGLEAGRVYSGAEVAAALETAMNNVGANDYTVTYDLGVVFSNTFNITNNDGAHSSTIQSAASSINKVIGFDTLANTVIAAGGTAETIDPDGRIFYISETVNDSFEIMVDQNPITGAPVTIRLNEGNYTGDELQNELENRINTVLAGEGEAVSVDVSYDVSDVFGQVFMISSSSLGIGSAIDLDPGQNNFLLTINISEYDQISGSYGYIREGYITGDLKAGVTLTIYEVSCGGNTVVDTVVTDSNGYYIFDGLVEGFYKIIPEDEDYYIFVPEYYFSQIPQTSPETLDFNSLRIPYDNCASVSSDEHTTQGFVFDDSAYIPNTSVTFDDGSGNVTVSVTGAAGGLENDRVYTGDEVASALESAMEDTGTNLYTVTYDNISNIFEIQNDGADACIIDQTGTINKVLGLSTTANTVIAAGGATSITDSRIYVISEFVNDTFGITVDNNPILGEPVIVRLNAGSYTADELERELENYINMTLAGEAESVSVDVRYDESDSLNKVFIIASTSHHSGSSIDLDPGMSNFLSTIKVSNYDEQSGGECAPTTL